MFRFVAIIYSMDKCHGLKTDDVPVPDAHETQLESQQNANDLQKRYDELQKKFSSLQDELHATKTELHSKESREKRELHSQSKWFFCLFSFVGF